MLINQNQAQLMLMKQNNANGKSSTTHAYEPNRHLSTTNANRMWLVVSVIESNRAGIADMPYGRCLF